MKTYKTILTTLSVLVILSTVYVSNVSAHCDTLDGPHATVEMGAARGGKGNPGCLSENIGDACQGIRG